MYLEELALARLIDLLILDLDRAALDSYFLLLRFFASAYLVQGIPVLRYGRIPVFAVNVPSG